MKENTISIERQRIFSKKTTGRYSSTEGDIKEDELFLEKSNIFIYADGGVGKSFFAQNLSIRRNMLIFKKFEDIKFVSDMIIDCWDEMSTDERKNILDLVYKKKLERVFVFGRHEGLIPSDADGFSVYEMKVVSEKNVNRTQRIIEYSRQIFGENWFVEINKYTDYEIIEKFISLPDESDISYFISMIAVKSALSGRMRIQKNSVKEEQRIFRKNNRLKWNFSLVENISNFPFLKSDKDEIYFSDKTIQSFFISRFLRSNLNIRNLYLSLFSTSNEIAYFYEAFSLIHLNNKRESLDILNFYEMPLILDEYKIELYTRDWAEILNDDELFSIIKMINVEKLNVGGFKMHYALSERFSIQNIRSFFYTASPNEPYKSSGLASICGHFSTQISEHASEFRKLAMKLLGFKRQKEIVDWVINGENPHNTACLLADIIDVEMFKELESKNDWSNSGEALFHEIEPGNSSNLREILKYLLARGKISSPKFYRTRHLKYLEKYNISWEWLLNNEATIDVEMYHKKEWLIFWLNQKGSVKIFSDFLSGKLKNMSEKDRLIFISQDIASCWVNGSIDDEFRIEESDFLDYSNLSMNEKYYIKELIKVKSTPKKIDNKKDELIQKIRRNDITTKDIVASKQSYSCKFHKHFIEIIYDNDLKSERLVIKRFVKKLFNDLLVAFDNMPNEKLYNGHIDMVMQLYRTFYNNDAIPYNNHLLYCALKTNRYKDGMSSNHRDGDFINSWYEDYLDKYLTKDNIINLTIWRRELVGSDLYWYFEKTNRALEVLDVCMRDVRTAKYVDEYVENQLTSGECHLNNLKLFVNQNSKYLDLFGKYILSKIESNQYVNYSHIMHAIELKDHLSANVVNGLTLFFKDIIYEGILHAAEFSSGTVTKYIEFWGSAGSEDAEKLLRAFGILDIELEDEFALKIFEIFKIKNGSSFAIAVTLYKLLKINDRKYSKNTIRKFLSAEAKYPSKIEWVLRTVNGDVRNYGKINFQLCDYYVYLNGQIKPKVFKKYIIKSIERINLIIKTKNEIAKNEKEMQKIIHEEMIRYCLQLGLVWHREFSPFLKGENVGWIDFSISHNNLYSVIELKNINDRRFGTEEYNAQLRKYSTNYRKIEYKHLIVYGDIYKAKSERIKNIREVAKVHGFEVVFVSTN